MGFWDNLNPFAGMSGTEIYHNFRGGTGDDGRGLYMAAWRVVKITKSYEERATSITKLTSQMESAWQGDAAGAARRGAGPLAVEHGLAQDSMLTAHNTLQGQFDAFLAAKGSVTEVPPTPDKPSGWDNLTSLGGAGRNYENQMTHVNAANDNNVQVMEAYEGESESNATRMPTTYGRITDDYAAVGVERPIPPTPPVPYEPPPGTGTDPGSGNNNSNNNSSNTPGHNNTPGLNQNNNQNGNTTNPNQTTNPSDFRPPPTFDPPRNLPPGQNPGQNPNHPGMPGMMPPATFGPNGGGDGTGRPGGRGGFGPGGRGGGGFGPGGSGSGAGGPGSGGPGSGARGLGSGFGPGGAAAAEGAAARGGLGGPGGGAGGGRGGGGMGGGGRRGEGEEDGEHERPSFLVEPDPHETFGTDEVTAPPVIGE